MVDVTKLSGATFREWELHEELGRGGSAIVYAAQKGTQHAAIKIFLLDALGKHGFSVELERLELQLQLKGKKQHLHLVEIFEGGVAEELGSTLFLVMEKVDGQTLDKVLPEIPRASLGTLIKQLSDAAQFLEQQDLVHRDIKPENIVINDSFSSLTLLDFGVVKNLLEDESGRLSGNRFVATPRYSPPEFVWRNEVESPEAWRAITFYQIGGTLHDLIMKKRLFDGQDEPPARLYDSIKLTSPAITANDCDDWLVVLAKSCLVKDWRERLRLVNWESFSQPEIESSGIAQKQAAIRLRQIRREEIEFAKQAQHVKAPQEQRIEDLWNLQDGVLLDIRHFLSGTQIFPRFVTNHSCPQPTQYIAVFQFEKAIPLGFQYEVRAEIELSCNADLGESTELKVRISNENGEIIFEGEWVEILTIDGASSTIQQALLQAADKIVPQA